MDNVENHMPCPGIVQNDQNTNCLKLIYTVPVAGMLAGTAGRSLAFGHWNWQVTGTHCLHDASS